MERTCGTITAPVVVAMLVPQPAAEAPSTDRRDKAGRVVDPEYSKHDDWVPALPIVDNMTIGVGP